MATKRQPVYSEEFRKEIVKMTEDGDKNPYEVGREYGIAGKTIKNWVVKYGSSPKYNEERKATAQDLELREKDKRIRYLEMELDILKKAVAIVSKV